MRPHLLAFALLLFSSVRPAVAAFRPIQSTKDVGAGALLLLNGDGGYVAAPALTTDVSVRVLGIVAHTEVVQRFKNDDSRVSEGRYVFPLPEGAAVDRMRLQIGERTIEGKIAEKAEAERIFQEAKRTGKRASLLEQSRPNMFSTRVANIGPGDDIEVRIEYQETLRYETEEGRGRFSLRFPLAITPRYTPAASASGFVDVPLEDVCANDGSEAQAASINIDLDAGFEVDTLESLYHRVVVEGDGEQRRIWLADASVPLDRDFVLEWSPRLGAEPKAAFLQEEDGDETYGLLMLMPPTSGAERSHGLPRETTFIIDSSGSMSGASMAQAKAALKTAISSLAETDRFEVIDFDDEARPLFGSPRDASPANREVAVRFVDDLDADGGTEMSGALRLALRGVRTPGFVSQIIFVTDGAVGNEIDLYKMIHQDLGGRRLYTVGIGSAPNAWFMRGAAKAGQGTYTYIGKTDEVEARMKSLFAKIDTPLLSDLSVTFSAAGDAGASHESSGNGGLSTGAVGNVASVDVCVEMFPDRLPDLYAGEPIVVAMRFGRKLHGQPTRVRVEGHQIGARFARTLDLRQTGAKMAGIGKLWARQKIEALTDRIVLGTPEAEVEPEILRLALTHGLLSKYTSLVAVDTQPAKTDPGLEAESDDAAGPAYADALPQGGTEARLMFAFAAALACLLLIRCLPRLCAPASRR